MVERGTATGTERFAVVMVDLQNDFCHPDGVFDELGFEPVTPVDDLVANVNQLTEVARDADVPVVWLQNLWGSDDEVGLIGLRRPVLRTRALRVGTWGGQLLAELVTSDRDVFIRKSRFSGFYRTELEDVLREQGVTTLIVGGIRTDYCVESTVRDAFFRDFSVLLVEDAVTGYVKELHETTLRHVRDVFGEVVSIAVAIQRMQDT